MNCFPCFKSKTTERQEVQVPVAQAKEIPPSTQPAENPKPIPSNEVNNKKDNAPAVDTENISAKNFTFRELATATKNFKRECLLGEGGFGRVFKGTFQSTGQVVTVKQLDKNSTQGNKEFLVEVMMLSLLHHPNLVELIGYCADGDQRLLVYEYLPRGSVEDNLLDLKPDKKPLDWATRMKIASGTALGLEYLHEKANPPVIYRDLKSSNIMLDEEFNAKLYDYGLAKLGAGTTHVTPRVMGNYGYSAPEYERLGEATMKSDVYSFGVILLELITGRRALDTSRPADEQNLVSWVQPFFKDPKTFPEMADPLLRKEFPVTSLNQAVGVAAMCLQDEPSVRPLIGDVVAALGFLAVAPPDQTVPKTLQAPTDGHSSVEVAPPDHPVPDNFHPPTDDHDSVAVAPPHHNTLQAPNDQSDPNTLQPPTDHKNVAMAPPAVQALSDHSRGDSSSSKVEKSNSKTHEHKDHNQEDRSGSDNESSASSVSSDDEDAYKKENEELDYEVASMSSDSISSSDDESQYGSINKRSNRKSESRRGNNSLKLKRKSTRKTNEGSVRSSSRRRNGEESSHGTLGSGLGDGSQHGSARSSSRRISSRSSSRHISSISSRRNGEESSHGTLGSGLGDGSQRGSVHSSSRRRNGEESSRGSLGSGLGDGSQRGSVHSSSRCINGEESSHGTLGSGLGDGSQRGSVLLNSRGSSN